ncbi:MAG: DNA repair protein RadC [Tannerellaceae bacterium]|nr:DNA repair protein RadC [Tannerellaceae bacterium]
MKKFTIKQWPEDDRPREKLLKRGPGVLTDAELLAILIGCGTTKESAVHLAQRILASVKNNLNTLGKLSVKELKKDFMGIGTVKAITILAALELGKRHIRSEALPKNKIKTSGEAFHYFYPWMSDLPHEEVWVAFVNQAGTVKEKLKVSQGGVTNTAVDIRLILKAAVDFLASGIILCHNHPSGNLKPSPQDGRLTLRLKEAALLIDLQLLDHIIISDTKYYSYADEGRII